MKIKMEIITVTNTPIGKNPHGVDARMIYNHTRARNHVKAQVVHITLHPGESLKRHITPVDVFFYVLEGEGIIEIGDEKQTVQADTIIHSPAKNIHCWYNESPHIVRILVAKIPKPTTSTILL